MSVPVKDFILRNWPYLAAAGGLLLVLAFHSIPYVTYIASLVIIYAIIAVGLNIMTGWTGYIIFCPSAFAIIGGYISAMLVLNGKIPFLVALLLAAAGAAAVSLIISGAAVVVGRGYELILLTFCFELVVYYVLMDLKWTGGSLGMRDIPPPSFLKIVADDLTMQYIFLLFIIAIVFALVLILHRSRTGLLIRTIREDETLTEAIGNSSTRYKFLAITIGAAFCGLGGALYAHILHTISPAAFSFSTTCILLMILVLGGMGTILGPLLGGAMAIGLSEALQPVGEIRMLIFGLILVVTMVLLPKGIVGTLSRRF